MTAMDPTMNGNGGPPPLPNGTMPEDPAMGVQAALRAFRVAGENMASESNAAEAKDWADAALKIAQAIVVLDPEVSQGGTPLQHDVAMKAIDHETQKAVATIQGDTAVRVEHVRGDNALKQARETAAAPSPAKRLAVRRDGTGRMTGIEQEG